MSIIYNKTKDGSIQAAVCGKLTRDPEVRQGSKGEKVKFAVCYGKSQFMPCYAWADSDLGKFAMCLEKGDTVLAMGPYRTWTYEDAPDKQQQCIDVDGIFPMTMPLASAQAEPKATNNSADKSDDGWESLDNLEEGLPF